ncbi:MAG TPA: hypothetical protein VN943_03360 [Candidatus Acidoferrum sp.]|nr:hypothetical protein [Candidatus Acidoferrum sp.]
MFLESLSTIFLSSLLVGAPAQAGAPRAPAENSKLSQMHRSIDAWIECDDCNESQQNAVFKAGQAAVPVLVQYLREGPSPEKRELVRRQLVSAYHDLKEYEKRHPQATVPLSEEEYVRTYLDNYSARYQIRAAAALAAIGGTEARSAVEAVLRNPLRDDVKAALASALQRMRSR